MEHITGKQSKKMKPERGDDGDETMGKWRVMIVFGQNNSTATSSKILMVCQTLKKGLTNTLYPRVVGIKLTMKHLDYSATLTDLDTDKWHSFSHCMPPDLLKGGVSALQHVTQAIGRGGAQGVQNKAPTVL